MLPEGALAFLEKEYQFHTAILHGSRALGRFRSDSDYDLILIKREGERVRKDLNFNGVELDVVVEPEAICDRPGDLLCLHHAIIVKDELGLGAKLVARVQEILASPPPSMPPERIAHRQQQVRDSLKKIRQADIVGHYRLHNLLMCLLPLYCSLRRIWYLGDRHTLMWLKNNDPAIYALFERALMPNATFADIESLSLRVIDLGAQ